MYGLPQDCKGRLGVKTSLRKCARRVAASTAELIAVSTEAAKRRSRFPSGMTTKRDYFGGLISTRRSRCCRGSCAGGCTRGFEWRREPGLRPVGRSLVRRRCPDACPSRAWLARISCSRWWLWRRCGPGAARWFRWRRRGGASPFSRVVVGGGRGDRVAAGRTCASGKRSCFDQWIRSDEVELADGAGEFDQIQTSGSCRRGCAG